MKDFNNHAMEICDKLGWRVEDLGDDIQLSQDSPCGEDFSFVVAKEGFAENVKSYAYDFDVDEHVELFVDIRGTRGVPESISTLVKDAEDIEEMLTELSSELNKEK